ncbi:MAG: energy-dependent translational throttle protein EttA [Planctomycetes bacterium]|nr:energy-dependent translational throttle protein EttA [Planctomycetota bacterium]MDP6423485.1 energy-dependent translational throttle protein EttA [Planctomycetota bacterium]
MSKGIFNLVGLKKAYGLKVVLDDIHLTFLEGARIGMVGHNGAGKTTLLRIIAGEDKAFEGEAYPVSDLTIGYVPQEPVLDPDTTVQEQLEEAVAPIRQLVQGYEDLATQMAEPLDDDAMQRVMNKMADLQNEIDAKDAWELDRQLAQASHALGLPDLDANIGRLSGGETRRVALCKVLISHPDLLLLDEPTNHLDADTVHWLETHLQNYKGTIILITHDRYFLDNVVTWMLEIERTQAIPYQGNYSAYLERKVSLLDGEKKQEAARQRRLKTELEWIRTNPKARSTKNKARLRRYEDMRQEQKEMSEDAIDLQIPPGKKLGTKVLESRGLSKAYGDNKLFEDLTFEVAPGAIVGVIGENGTGKTTLLRLIMGQETPDAGEVEMGKTVELCYVDQNRLTLEDKNTVYEEITDGLHELPFGQGFINSRAYLARFNFKGEDQQKKVGELSGGQRNRVQLAKLLRHGGNLIMLDEPTNDLDLQTLRVLEEAVASFPGSAIVVSHDRYFLNRVVTHILALEGDGKWRFLLGDYDTYREIREREEGEADGKGTHRRLK